MLRQLLSISVSLTTRRSRPTISLRTLDFSSEAVPEPASPAPDQASDPTSLPDGTKQIPRLAADVINRRWQQQLQAAAKEGEISWRAKGSALDDKIYVS